MHSVFQCTNYRLTTFFGCNLPQTVHTFKNLQFLQLHKQSQHRHQQTYYILYTYLCTYIYACMLPLLTKSMWLCKRNYLIDRFMYLLWELYYHKMAQIMCLFVQKRYQYNRLFNVLICNCKREWERDIFEKVKYTIAYCIYLPSLNIT